MEAASGHIAAAEVMLTLSGQTLTQDSLAAITSTNSLAIGAATLVQTGASIESTAGNVTLTLANGLAQDSASRIIADAGNIVASSIGTLAGDGPVSLAAGGSISATAGLVQLISLGGDIAQTAPGMTDFTGVIDAASLAVQAGVPSGAAYNLLLGGGHNRFGTLVDTAGGTYSGASGSVLLADQAPLALAAGAALLAGGNATITLTEPATLTQDASSLITAGGSVTVQAATLTQLGGAALTGGTGVMVAGNLLQTGQDQVTATQGDVTVTGSATQTFSAITAQGDATIGSLSQTSSSLTSGGAVIIGPAQAATGALVLDQHAASMISAGTSVTVYGAATQDVSRLSAIDQVVIYGSLGQTGSFLSGASVTIGQNGLAGTLSQIASSITAVSGDLTVTMSGDVAQDTGSTLASPSGDILLTTTGGQMALGGLISVAPQHEVSLVALGGDITQTAPVAGSPSGTLLAGTLSAQAGSAGGAAHNLVLDGAGVNQVGTVTQASATGTLLLIDSEALQELANGSITGQSGVTITAPNLTQLADSTIGSEFGAVQVRTNLLTQDRGASISAQSDVLLGGSLDQVSSTISSGRELSINGGLITQSSGSLTGAGGVLAQPGGKSDARFCKHDLQWCRRHLHHQQQRQFGFRRVDHRTHGPGGAAGGCGTDRG